MPWLSACPATIVHALGPTRYGQPPRTALFERGRSHGARDQTSRRKQSLLVRRICHAASQRFPHIPSSHVRHAEPGEANDVYGGPRPRTSTTASAVQSTILRASGSDRQRGGAKPRI